MTITETIKVIKDCFAFTEVGYELSDSNTQINWSFKDKELSLDKTNNVLYYRHKIGNVLFIKTSLYPANYKKVEELKNFLIDIIYIDY